MKTKTLKFVTISSVILISIYIFRNQIWGEPVSQIVKTQNNTNNNNNNNFKHLIGSKWVNQKNNLKSAELGFSIDGDIKETKGFFEKFDIVFKVSENNPEEAKMKVSIDVNSINTDNKIRDKALMESDFFNQEKYPKITYQSKKIKFKNNQITSEGFLNFMGIESKIEFKFEHKGVHQNNEGINVAIFEGEFAFDRTKYGMDHVASVGDLVKMHFYCELIKDY